MTRNPNKKTSLNLQTSKACVKKERNKTPDRNLIYK